MEKAKISAYQLFILAFFFEIGSSLLVSLAIGGAKQDAWLSILMGMAGGIVLFLIYHRLYQYYPDMLPMEYMQKIAGQLVGKVLAFIYILDFMYRSARNLRDFGDMLVTTKYPETPLFVISSLFVLTIIYTLRKGIEALARTGELFFTVIVLMGISGLLLIVFAGLIDTNNLKPILADGFGPVFKTFYTESLFVPFGEIFVIAMILPYLDDVKAAKKAVIYAMVTSGLILSFTMALNISVLGVSWASRSQFPLFATIQMIEFANFLERLDIYFVFFLVIGGLFKMSLYFYAAVIGTASLFNLEHPSRVVYPLGILILVLSISIASSFAEHIEEGHKVATMYIQIPLQIVIPILLLIVAFWKNRKNSAISKEQSK